MKEERINTFNRYLKRAETLHKKMDDLMMDYAHLGQQMEKTLEKWRQMIGQELEPTTFKKDE